MFSIKQPLEFITTKIAGDATLGTMITVSSEELASNHLKGSKQDKSDGSCETSSETETEDAVGQEDCGNNIGLNSKANAGRPSRKSSRQKQHISYAEKSIDDDIKKANSVSPIVASVKHAKEVTHKANVAGESKWKEEEPVNKTDKLSLDNCGSDLKPSPQEIEYPEPEFSDFEKQRAENYFAVNQVWAHWMACQDFMPGSIGCSILTSKLQITWLEPYPDEKNEQNWADLDLPVSCGKYYNGYTETCNVLSSD
ncbi:hypothetical protein V6N12_024150 [Hibiscus sabdariffa]|uniref:DUF3444 domain-containing protein n=1 Tax=Hibiscus sabdariffa TaxID=183260 RepID=A0ABR2FZR5_9ROSI